MQLHQSEDTVNNIITSKVASGHTRPHPDLPDDESARLYYVRGPPLHVNLSSWWE